MSIEGATSIGSVVSVGPGLGIEASLTARFGVALTAPLASSSLENHMPYTINNLNTPRNSLSIPESTQEVIAGVESILSQARSSPVAEVPAVFQKGLSDINLDPVQKHILKPADVIEEAVSQPDLKTKAMLGLVASRIFLPIPLEVLSTQPKIEQTATIKTQPAVEVNAGVFIPHEPNLVHTPPITEVQRIEPPEIEDFEEEEEEVEVEELEEGFEELRFSHMVDKKAVKKRVETIKNTGKKIEEEIKSELSETGKEIKIPGWRIVKYLLSLSGRDLRGQELEETDPDGVLPDGTWEANLEKVGQETFEGVAQIEERASKIVALDNPIAKGKGEDAEDKDMHTTYKHDKTRVHPVHQVIRRMVKIQKQRPQSLLLVTEAGIDQERSLVKENMDLALALKAA